MRNKTIGNKGCFILAFFLPLVANASGKERNIDACLLVEYLFKNTHESCWLQL